MANTIETFQGLSFIKNTCDNNNIMTYILDFKKNWNSKETKCKVSTQMTK